MSEYNDLGSWICQYVAKETFGNFEYDLEKPQMFLTDIYKEFNRRTKMEIDKAISDLLKEGVVIELTENTVTFDLSLI